MDLGTVGNRVILWENEPILCEQGLVYGFEGVGIPFFLKSEVRE